jgi:hypothetical protein
MESNGTVTRCQRPLGLLSRRTLNRLLQENRWVLADDKVGLHINHLNGTSAVQRLTTGWEVVVLNAFSKLDRVRHEPMLAGSVLVDLLFEWEGNIALIDITTVSDRGLDKANPIEQLCAVLVVAVQKQGLDPDKFYVQANGNSNELFLGGPKAQLYLPRPEDFRAVIFNARFDDYLTKVKQSQQKSSFVVKFD